MRPRVAPKPDTTIVRYRGMEVMCVPDTVTPFRAGKIPAADALVIQQVCARPFVPGVRTVSQSVG